MVRLFIITLVILFFFSATYTHADSISKSTKPSIYNEESLTQQLKGQGKEEVLKVLGIPAVKKPCEECKENLEY